MKSNLRLHIKFAGLHWYRRMRKKEAVSSPCYLQTLLTEATDLDFSMAVSFIVCVSDSWKRI